jgi:parallel beta-helix repeat protein
MWSATAGNEITNNTIAANDLNGIHLEGGTGTTVKGNLIGLTSINSRSSNGLNGILLSDSARGHFIGSSIAGEENYICWNGANGIKLEGNGTRENQVGGNIIGSTRLLNDAYSQAPNDQHGIALYDQTEANIIGRLGSIFTPNYIFSSKWSGIAVRDSNHNQILFNRIGTDGNTRDWGNTYWGINIVNGNNNVIRSNIIANNGKAVIPRAGVEVSGATAFGNHLLRNSIYNNGDKGISLVNGGNSDVYPPILQREGNTLIGTTYPGSEVQFFSGAERDEGRYYEGVTYADGAGVFNWQMTGNFKGKHVTAIATPLPAASSSEFSLPVQGAFPYILFQHNFRKK